MKALAAEGHDADWIARMGILREFDVLVCTTIVETGLDIANAWHLLLFPCAARRDGIARSDHAGRSA